MTKSRLHARHGIGVIEAIVAVALLALVLGVATKMGTTVLRYRAAMDRQRVMSEAERNLMEVAMSLPFDKLTEETLTAAASHIADGDWELQVVEVGVDTDHEELNPSQTRIAKKAKKIVVNLASGKRSKIDQLTKPLVAWRYPIEVRRDGGEP